MASIVLEERHDIIYNLAGECEELFSQTLSQLRATVADAINLFEEYQHRFIAWTAYLGVFAKESVCLDRRLRRHPEIHDLIIRLLDLLELNLRQSGLIPSSQSDYRI